MALERTYTIPLRREWEKAPRYKRANRAAKAVKEFLAQHMKIRDRDLKKVKIEKWLNMHLWEKGIRKPPARVKVKAIFDNGIVRAELAELPGRARYLQQKGEKKKKLDEKTKKEEKKDAKKEAKEEKKEEKGEKKTETVEENVADTDETKAQEKKEVKETKVNKKK